METSTFKANFKRYASLVGGLVIHMVLGSLYITGNITVYMSSYFQHSNINVTTSDLAILIPLQVFGKTVGTLFGSILSGAFNPKIAISIGCSITISSVFFSAFTINYYLILLLYGFTYGLGVGITYAVPLLISWSHFPQYKGRVTGFIMTGFGLGTSVFNLISTHLINPDNEHLHDFINGDYYFSQELANRFPTMLMELSFIYFGLTLIGLSLLANPRISHYRKVSVDCDGECASLPKALKTKEFWLVMFMVIFSLAPGYYIVSNFKIVGKEYIEDDKFLALVGSVSALIDACTRFWWGALMDRFSFKLTYGVILTVQASALFATYYILGSKVLYLICVACVLGCKGGQFVLVTTLCSKLYGKTMGTKVYGVVTYGVTLGAVVGYLCHIGIENSLGLQFLFTTLGVMSLISFSTLFCLTEKKLFKAQSPLKTQLIGFNT